MRTPQSGHQATTRRWVGVETKNEPVKRTSTFRTKVSKSAWQLTKNPV